MGMITCSEKLVPIYKTTPRYNPRQQSTFHRRQILKSPEVAICTVKVRLSGNSSNGKVALAAHFHRAHYNSPMALAAYFCRYPASRGISRAVPKFSESSTGGAERTDQLTRRPRLVFIITHIKIAYRRSLFSPTADSIYRHTPFSKRAG
jgi:hypothetical protein